MYVGSRPIACIPCIMHHNTLIVECRLSTRKDCACYPWCLRYAFVFWNEHNAINFSATTFRSLLMPTHFGHKKQWMCNCEIIRWTFHAVAVNLNLILTISLFNKKRHWNCIKLTQAYDRAKNDQYKLHHPVPFAKNFCVQSITGAEHLEHFSRVSRRHKVSGSEVS